MNGGGKSIVREVEMEEGGGLLFPLGNPKPKIVVVVGATGSGKSRLAIDLASHFPVEVVNADSMQVYEGLDILTNKVPPEDQKGVPHHLLGLVSANVEFTSKDFRDMAIPVIDSILFRKHLPVIVGGTNYYIQALVSPFLLDDLMEEMDECISGHAVTCLSSNQTCEDSTCDLDLLRKVDPVSANWIHLNDIRKVKVLNIILAYIQKQESFLVNYFKERDMRHVHTASGLQPRNNPYGGPEQYGSIHPLQR